MEIELPTHARTATAGNVCTVPGFISKHDGAQTSAKKIP